MDYFRPEGTCAEEQKKQKKTKQHSPNAPQANEVKGDLIESNGFTKEQIEAWAEPSVDQSGKVTSKLPPLPALRVLIDPNEDNAQAYLDWNKKRMKSLEEAQRIISKKSGMDQLMAANTVDDEKNIESVKFFFSPT